MSRERGFGEAPDAAVQRVCSRAGNAAVLHDDEESQVRGDARDPDVVVQRQPRIAIERGAKVDCHVECSDCGRPGWQQVSGAREHEAEHHALRGNHGDEEHHEADPDSPVEAGVPPRPVPGAAPSDGRLRVRPVVHAHCRAATALRSRITGSSRITFTRARTRRIRGDRLAPPEARPLREPARARRRHAAPLASQQARRSPP